MPPRRGDKGPSVHTLLLDMYERMGKVEAQNDQILREQASAREARATILQNQAFINVRMNDFDGGEKANYEGGFKTGLRDLSTLRKQLAVAALIATGGIQIFWYGILYFKEIAEFFKNIIFRKIQ